METLNAAELLAALGHESRLAIFRLLVEAGPEGLNASAIGEKLGMPAATLSFHLAHLSRVGLIRGERESRFIHYSAEYGTMDELIAFLTNNCCQGNACLPKTAACGTTEKRRSKTSKTSTS
jgi:DNA-binding transcriptional ArsR family regulator